MRMEKKTIRFEMKLTQTESDFLMNKDSMSSYMRSLLHAKMDATEEEVEIDIYSRTLDALRTIDGESDNARINYLLANYKKYENLIKKDCPSVEDRNKEVAPAEEMGAFAEVDLQCPKCLKTTPIGTRAGKQACEHCGYDFKSSV